MQAGEGLAATAVTSWSGGEIAALITAITGVALAIGRWWGERRVRQERKTARDLEASVALVNEYANLVRDLRGQVEWQATQHGKDRAAWASERAEFMERIESLESKVRTLEGQLERRIQDGGRESREEQRA